MMKYLLALVIVVSVPAFAQDRTDGVLIIDSATSKEIPEHGPGIVGIKPPLWTQYHFMEILVKTIDGKTDNGKFFVGPLPAKGDAVEMVFVDSDPLTGAMYFQLRKKR
jgi:hypothetical protein